jgi:hypothetical protein
LQRVVELHKIRRETSNADDEVFVIFRFGLGLAELVAANDVALDVHTAEGEEGLNKHPELHDAFASLYGGGV